MHLYTTLSFWSLNLIGKCADVYYSTGTFYCLYHSWLFLFPPVDGNKLLSFWVGHWFIHSDSFKHTDSFETLFIRKCIESFTIQLPDSVQFRTKQVTCLLMSNLITCLIDLFTTEMNESETCIGFVVRIFSLGEQNLLVVFIVGVLLLALVMIIFGNSFEANLNITGPYLKKHLKRPEPEVM